MQILIHVHSIPLSEYKMLHLEGDEKIVVQKVRLSFPPGEHVLKTLSPSVLIWIKQRSCILLVLNDQKTNDSNEDPVARHLHS